MKITWAKIRDYVYILTLLGIGCGWYVDHRITKVKNEMHEQLQDVKIEAQAQEITRLNLVTKTQEGYVQENANNIDWIVRIFVVEP